MNLSSCKNAIIYSDFESTTLLCEASVSDINGNSVVLTIKDEYIDDLDAEMNITFLDENQGLIIFKCQLSAPRKFLSPRGEWLNTIECELIEVVSSLQRREDFKIKVDLPVSIIIPQDIEIPDDFHNFTSEFGHNIVKGKCGNISAGGIYFTCDFKFKQDSETNIYISLSSGQKIRVQIKVLRVDELENSNGTKSYGHGCKYSKIPSGLESTIRNFVFKKQREGRKF